MFDPDARDSVETAIGRAIAPVHVRIGPDDEMRFAPIGEAKPSERVTVTGRDYEEMAECVCAELVRCCYLAPSADQNVVIGRIMRARKMKLGSKWQIYNPQAIILPEIFETLLQAGMLVEHMPASV